MESEEPNHYLGSSDSEGVGSDGSEEPQSREFEVDGEQYVALKKSDFVQYEEMVELAHTLMQDCVDRIFKTFKAIPQQTVVPPRLGPEEKD